MPELIPIDRPTRLAQTMTPNTSIVGGNQPNQRDIYPRDLGESASSTGSPTNNEIYPSEPDIRRQLKGETSQDRELQFRGAGSGRGHEPLPMRGLSVVQVLRNQPEHRLRAAQAVPIQTETTSASVPITQIGFSQVAEQATGRIHTLRWDQ